MRFPRSSGILLHPTSLPGPHGSGDFGEEALGFLNFLEDAGQKLWQVLPLHPTGYADSPYQCLSAFAGNPLLISLERLAVDGLIEPAELAEAPAFPSESIEYGLTITFRFALLRKAAARFFDSGGVRDANYAAFCAAHAGWLDDYALFMALKDYHQGAPWTMWPPELAQRSPAALERSRWQLAPQIATYKFWQYEFFRQWHSIREACRQRGIRVMGDIPIYVAHDSAEVWTAPELFWLDEHGAALKVAGVPPDYFSRTGQLWGNPLYRWERLREDGYRWWIRRLRAVLEMYDVIRIDHFRGFEAYFEIPAGEPTAVNGVWREGPGAELFECLERELGGELPIVAENLGNITPEVEAIRRRFGFPGMAILQFAFGNDPQAPNFRPHNYEHSLVAYTGVHDNDTTVGWWQSGTEGSTRTEADLLTERSFATEYLKLCEREEIQWAMIRTLMASVADTVLFPMQDVLGLGSWARMNLPGSMGGNWRWRYRREQLRPEMVRRLRSMTNLYDR